MLRNSNVTVEGNRIVIDGDCLFDLHGVGGVDFRGIISVQTNGGTITANDDELVVRNARQMTIVCDIRTNYADKDFIQLCNRTVAKAEATSYKHLRQTHMKDFSQLFNRMTLTLSDDETALGTTT